MFKEMKRCEHHHQYSSYVLLCSYGWTCLKTSLDIAGPVMPQFSNLWYTEFKNNK